MKRRLNPSKKREWEARIGVWESSGKSAHGWCKEQSVSLSTFKYWRKKIDSEALDPKAFFEIPQEQQFAGIEIRCQGFEIHVKKGSDEATLSLCLKAIRNCLC